MVYDIITAWLLRKNSIETVKCNRFVDLILFNYLDKLDFFKLYFTKKRFQFY